jgi:hypothetical protein
MVVTVTVGNGTPVTVGVVEGMDINLAWAGGPEPYYGSEQTKHSQGHQEATFNLTRWFFTDTGQEDLLLDLFAGQVEFELEGHLQDNQGNLIANSQIKITGCRLYKWRPRTGHANDIIGEEGTGSGRGWDFSGFVQTTTSQTWYTNLGLSARPSTQTTTP